MGKQHFKKWEIVRSRMNINNCSPLMSYRFIQILKYQLLNGDIADPLILLIFYLL